MIPVENIYYLLCYAWNHFDEGDMAALASLETDSPVDLLAYALWQGVSRIFRRGLDKGYLEQEDILSALRGRIDVGYTIRRNLHKRGLALCRFDEFETDILLNRIIKSTIQLLLRMQGLDKSIKEKLSGVYQRFPFLTDIELKPSVFSRLTLHRNNSHYRFTLNICELIVSYAIPDEKTGNFYFRDFLRDEVKMALLFQHFVFNFYSKEQQTFTVKSDSIKWLAEALSVEREGDLSYLPGMITDISMHSPDRSIIIDTKYYAEVLKSKYKGHAKVNSSNLYQLHAYLKNLENKGFPLNQAEGILLYPTNGYKVDLAWKISGHVIRVRTIDLGMHWRDIAKRLLKIIYDQG